MAYGGGDPRRHDHITRDPQQSWWGHGQVHFLCDLTGYRYASPRPRYSQAHYPKTFEVLDEARGYDGAGRESPFARPQEFRRSSPEYLTHGTRQ